MKRYEIIDHTADIGLRAFGKDKRSLFINAACGMSSIIADLKNVRTDKSIKLKLDAPNIEELFLLWLSELLYQYNNKRIIFKDFVIEQIDENHLLAHAEGEKLNLQKHKLKTEIKAVTYHELKVKQVKDAYCAEVIFDI